MLQGRLTVNFEQSSSSIMRPSNDFTLLQPTAVTVFCWKLPDLRLNEMNTVFTEDYMDEWYISILHLCSPEEGPYDSYNMSNGTINQTFGHTYIVTQHHLCPNENF
ncbi:hypothetical protein TNCV_899451 [Trichonephila clavipes]|nr:hypothetical protein TNCV_899451 [Trichonephila clavipes]